MSYYGKLCTLMYDLDKPFVPNEEMAFYRKYLYSKDIDILEPMCGSGRIYIPFLKEGYKIDGFDISKDMLQACMDKCREIGIKPTVSQQDITEFDMKKKYDLIFIPFGSICLLTEYEKLHKSLMNINGHLKDNGKFVVSFLNESAKSGNINEFIETKRRDVGEAVLIEYWKVQYVSNNCIMDYKLKYELVNDGTIIEEEYMDFPIKLYSEEEFSGLLRGAGFTQIEKVSMDGTNISASDERMVVLECSKE